MEYLVPIILGTLAIVGWFKPQNASTTWIVIFLFCTVSLVVFQLILQKKQNSTIEQSKNYGVLRSMTPVFSSRVHGVTLQVGWQFDSPGATFIYRGGPLSNMFPGVEGTPFQIPLDEISLEINKRNDEIFVSILLRDINGLIIAELQNNEWKINTPPMAFDRNYKDDMLEIKDSRGDIVLQLRVFKKRVQLNGVFYGSNGYGVTFFPPPKDKANSVQMEILGKNKRPSRKLTPIFKYPSDLHFGELDLSLKK